MLSNLQVKVIFSVLKKTCKNEYICPSNICLSDIITSSSISLIIFFIDFLSHKKIESYPCIPIIWWNTKKYIILSSFDKIRRSTLFFKATFLWSPFDIILLKPTNFSKQDFMENINYYLLELSLLDFFM